MSATLPRSGVALNELLAVNATAILESQHGAGITKYEGNRFQKDRTTFRSFEAARKAARKRIKQQIKDLQDELSRVETMKEHECELVRNPFW